jgi:hypothetical protein
MIVAGGLYFETCEAPAWRRLFGSGGRAAWALGKVSPNTQLHTYVSPRSSAELSFYQQAGVTVVGTASRSTLVFAYFHPLSRPHIEPPSHSIEQEPPIFVEGESALRFGFLEGNAVVHAERAVYDPQNSTSPQRFTANGSHAERLALVLNEGELQRATRLVDMNAAAQSILASKDASVVVVKRGTRGALVFEDSGLATEIPPYLSQCVFKIGSGDIFSAAFAYFWAERKETSPHSAELASRAVAAYCNDPVTQISETPHFSPIAIKAVEAGCVLLLGPLVTLGDRWMLEEARWCLRELGANVKCPALGDADDGQVPTGALALYMDQQGAKVEIESAGLPDLPIVVLSPSQDRQSLDKCMSSHTTVTDDFASAIYFAYWKSAH